MRSPSPAMFTRHSNQTNMSRAGPGADAFSKPDQVTGMCTCLYMGHVYSIYVYTTQQPNETRMLCVYLHTCTCMHIHLFLYLALSLSPFHL